MNGEGRRILIVDDARNVADTTALIFAHAGYEVKTAYSAKESIELIREWSHQPPFSMFFYQEWTA